MECSGVVGFLCGKWEAWGDVLNLLATYLAKGQGLDVDVVGLALRARVCYGDHNAVVRAARAQALRKPRQDVSGNRKVPGVGGSQRHGVARKGSIKR